MDGVIGGEGMDSSKATEGERGDLVVEMGE